MAPRLRVKKDQEIIIDESARNAIAQQVQHALNGICTPAITIFNKSATLSLELFDPSDPKRKKTLVERKIVFQRRWGTGWQFGVREGPEACARHRLVGRMAAEKFPDLKSQIDQNFQQQMERNGKSYDLANADDRKRILPNFPECLEHIDPKDSKISVTGVAFKDENERGTARAKEPRIEYVIMYKKGTHNFWVPWSAVKNYIRKEAVIEYATKAEMGYRCWRLITMGFKKQIKNKTERLNQCVVELTAQGGDPSSIARTIEERILTEAQQEDDEEDEEDEEEYEEDEEEEAQGSGGQRQENLMEVEGQQAGEKAQQEDEEEYEEDEEEQEEEEEAQEGGGQRQKNVMEVEGQQVGGFSAINSQVEFSEDIQMLEVGDVSNDDNLSDGENSTTSNDSFQLASGTTSNHPSSFTSLTPGNYSAEPSPEGDPNQSPAARSFKRGRPPVTWATPSCDTSFNSAHDSHEEGQNNIPTPSRNTPAHSASKKTGKKSNTPANDSVSSRQRTQNTPTHTASAGIQDKQSVRTEGTVDAPVETKKMSAQDGTVDQASANQLDLARVVKAVIKGQNSGSRRWLGVGGGSNSQIFSHSGANEGADARKSKLPIFDPPSSSAPGSQLKEEISTRFEKSNKATTLSETASALQDSDSPRPSAAGGQISRGEESLGKTNEDHDSPSSSRARDQNSGGKRIFLRTRSQSAKLQSQEQSREQSQEEHKPKTKKKLDLQIIKDKSADGKINDFTINQMKDFLIANNMDIQSGWRKSDYITALEEYIRTRSQSATLQSQVASQVASREQSQEPNREQSQEPSQEEHKPKTKKKLDLQIIKDKIADGKMNDFTINQMKDFLVANNVDIQSGWRKSDYITALEEIRLYHCS